jgi:hypothetical protein
MIEYPTMEENPPQRVRAGQKYIFRRSGMDTVWSEHCPNIHDGTPVVVTQLPSSPKPGTMGQVHISDLNGNFLGMCSMHSLMTQTDELERSGQVKMVKHNPAERERIAVGDVVKYARHFLQSTGMYTGAIPFAEGQVTSIRQGIASINWNTEEAPSRVNIVNLVRKDRLHLESNPGDIHIDIGSHNENPDHVKDFNNTVMKILMGIPGVKYAEAGRMGTGKWFYEVEWENQAFSRQENLDSPPALLAAARRFAVSHRHRVPQGAFEKNPPLEILSTRMEAKGSKMILHYRITTPMNSVKDVEKILKTLYPGWRAISHGSLKSGTYPNVKHAYGVTMVKTYGAKNPPLPASALMDIATAKTTAHEVEEGLRPLGNLGTVDHLLDRGLQKLRGSHLGNVDWQNPPMQRSDAVQIVEEIYDELDFLLNELHQKKVLASDQHHLFVRVMGRLNRLKHAINNKWIVNPGPGRIQRYKTRHPQSAVEIYKDIVEIKAIKRDGKRYVHKFGKGSHILGLPDGSILIESRKGKRLWKNFKAGG